MTTARTQANESTFALSPIYGARLATVVGGVNWNQAVDNGNRWAVPGGIIGGAVAAVPSAGIATEAGVLAGTGIGWAGGAIADLAHQERSGIAKTAHEVAGQPDNFLHSIGNAMNTVRLYASRGLG
jgi:hypothetical protein